MSASSYKVELKVRRLFQSPRVILLETTRGAQQRFTVLLDQYPSDPEARVRISTSRGSVTVKSCQSSSGSRGLGRWSNQCTLLEV